MIEGVEIKFHSCQYWASSPSHQLWSRTCEKIFTILNSCTCEHF